MLRPQRFYEFGDFRVDSAARRLTRRDGERVRLTPRLFDTLLYLIEHDDRVIDKEELLAEMWPGRVVEENNLNQSISALRRALGDTDAQRILTVPGRGYRFVAASREVAEGPLPPVAQTAPAERRDNVVQLRVVGRSLGSPSTAPRPSAGPGRAISSLAVLPFKPLVQGQRDEVLLMGMAELLITRLSASQAIAVRPLGVVRRYGSTRQDPLAAARELGVDAVLDGGVLRVGDRLRITGRLLRTLDGVALWADAFDEPFADVFAVQDAITERVARALELPLAGESLKRLTARQTNSVEAYQLYLSGRHHLGKLKLDELRSANGLFERAIAIDSRYALAHAGIADVYRRLPIACDLSPAENFPKAEAAAQRALALDSQQPEAHFVLGFVRFWYDWRWAEAEAEFQRAVELNPGTAEPHLGYAHLLSNIGQQGRAIAEIRKARELDPLSLIANTLEGAFLSLADRDDEALARLQSVFDIEPDFWIARLHSGNIHLKHGRNELALSDLRKARERSGEAPHTLAALAHAEATTGNAAAARATLAALQLMSQTRHVPLSNFAVVHCGLGDVELALDGLEQAYLARDLRMTFLRVDWRWEPLRQQPRFLELLRKMNLENA